MSFQDRPKPKSYKERNATYMSKTAYTFLPKELKEAVDQMDVNALLYFLEKNGEDGKYFEQTLTLLGLIAEQDWKGRWQQEQWNKEQIEKGNPENVRSVRSPLSQDKQLLIKVVHACLYEFLITHKGEVK